MQRELKFRVWDKLENKFTKEDGIYLLEGPIFELTNSDPERWIIMQYTGLKDCEGKEIYEGDIIERLNLKMPIKWHRCGFHMKTEDKCFLPLDRMLINEFKIIGNIYENPELLEKEK